MSDNDTLLAYLVPTITSQVEVAATKSLAYILNKSPECRRVLIRIFGDAEIELDSIERLTAEETLSETSRLDLVGYDADGVRRLLVEAKFWASLGEGQASGYIKLVEGSGLGALLFLCPDAQVEYVWSSAIRQLEGPEFEVQEREAPNRVRAADVKHNGFDGPRVLLLVSWKLLLDRMAQSTSHLEVSSDIRQLQGLAQRQDEEGFVPIPSGGLSRDYAKRSRHLNRLIDEAHRRAVAEELFTSERLNATPRRYGYGRYCRFVGAESFSWLGINHNLWAEHGHSPLWVSIDSTDLPLGETGLGALKVDRGESRWLPLRLKAGAEYDEVLEGVVRQLGEVAALVPALAKGQDDPAS